jgi:hypothetical protein
MRQRMAVLLLMICAVIAASGEGRNAWAMWNGAAPAQDGQVTEWKGSYGGFRDRGAMVIRNRDGGAVPGFFTKLTSETRVDFSRQMIIAIFLGEKRTGGYGIHITKAEETDGIELLELPRSGIWDPQIDEVRQMNSVAYSKKKVFVVEYEEVSPGQGSIVTQALTTPYAFKLVPKSDLPVVFVRYEKVRQ